MSPIPPARTRTDRHRVHIKALIDEIKHQTSAPDTPLYVQTFLSGMLSGLTASVEILDGGTAEKSLELMAQRLAAAIGQAYIDGKLPEQPAPNPDPEEEASSPNTLHAELEQAQAAITRVRRLCEMTIENSIRVQAIDQARDTLAALDNTPLTTPAVVRLLDCGLCYEEHGEEVHPHPECPVNAPDRPVMTPVTDGSEVLYCRSEEGITVGLVDALISILRVLAPRDLSPTQVQEALADLREDPDLATVTTAPTEWRAADHIGHGSPCEETAGGSCARPGTTALRELVAEALWSADHPGWSTQMTDSDTADRYRARADAVLAVILPDALTADATLARMREYLEARLDQVAVDPADLFNLLNQPKEQ